MPTCPVRPKRMQFLLGALIAAGLIAFALYLQRHLGEDPCPLCIFQRVAVISAGLFFLLGALIGHSPMGARVASSCIAISSAIGGAIALRQIWIQHLPEDQIPECGPGLNYLLDSFPLDDVVRKVLQGSGECAHVGWTLLGLSIPEWTLLWFLVFILWAWRLARR